MSISISSLSKKYGTQTVLNNIDLQIGEGEVVGFLGPNGAGKTTCMKIITGSLAYDGGTVKVCGLEVKDNELAVKSLIGYLPEQNPLYPEMYIKEYLLFVAGIYKIDNADAQVEALIEQVGLLPERHKKIAQLSKGYKQRVGLAQALMHNPQVLVLDEPTTGLDPNQLEEIRNLIRTIGKDKTVLLSTHIMQEIKAICNRVIIINKGNIVADLSDVNAIGQYDEGLQKYELETLSAMPIAVFESAVGVVEVKQLTDKTYSLLCKTDMREQIFDMVLGANNKLLQLKTIERSMEEIFRTLTKNNE